MRNYFLLSIALLSCSGEEITAPENYKTIYFILQQSNEVKYIGEGGIITAFTTGDVPNWLIFEGDSIILINSGGFTGTPSIYIVSNNTIAKFPLDNSYNPLEGIYLNGKIILTDFGKSFSRKLLVFQNGRVIDSLILSPRPISVKYINGYIYASTNGMDENYNYVYPSKLYRIDTGFKIVDSISLREGASSNGIGYTKGFIYFLSSGIMGSKKACIYKLDPLTLNVLDSLELPRNAYSFSVNDTLVLAGDFFGILYITNTEFNRLDSVVLGRTINFINSDGKLFYISINGYSGTDDNYIVIYDGTKFDSIRVSDGDLGIGFVGVR